MANVWSLNSEELSHIRDALDDFITNWGKDCTIVYPPAWEECPDCTYDVIGGKSTNYYKTGGPMPFADGTICPMCNGVGKFRSEVATRSLKLLCEFNPARFFYPVPSIDLRVPYSVCQVKGYLSELPHIQRADHILVQTPISGTTRLAYKMAGEGLDFHNIVQGRYCVVTLARTGA